MSVKPYLWTKNAYNAELDKLEAPLPLDKLEVPLPTIEVYHKLTKPTKPAVKCGRGRLQKHPITRNPIIKNYLTSAGISIRQPLPINILVLIQETPFIDL